MPAPPWTHSTQLSKIRSALTGLLMRSCGLVFPSPVHFGVSPRQATASHSKLYLDSDQAIKPSSPLQAAASHHTAVALQVQGMARPAPLVASTATVLLLFLFSSSCCLAASSSSNSNPSAVVLAVRKDDATGQYEAGGFRQRTPQAPVTAVLDLGGATLWVDCDPGRYASSSYARVPCASKPCRLARTGACATSCAGAPSPGCLNDTCGGFPENTVTRLSTGGNLITDVLSLPTTFRPAPGPLATVPAFLFACGATFLTKGLAAGAAGMASLSRARFALPTQLADTFRFPRKFALCLPPASGAGFVLFGDAPYAFQPGVEISKSSLVYTPLLVNNVSTAGVSGKGDKSTEYFIGVTAIKVNGRAVPRLNATLLAIDGKTGVGGTKLSTVAPYTVLETSIHQAVTDAFAAETAMAKIPRVPSVPPFRLCYDGSKVGSTRVGPAVPTVELVLQSEAASWVVFGANSMVATEGGALCLAVVDGGRAPRTSVVVGGHMMENNLLEFDLQGSRLGFSSSLLFRQTTCNNFRLG